MLRAIYITSVLVNFLIALLATPIAVAFLISAGQLFHNFAVSMQKLLVPAQFFIAYKKSNII